MKYYLPKTVNICGSDCKVELDKNSSGGEYRFHDGRIKIGTQKPKSVVEIFLHEVIEGILHERGHRYTKYEDINDGIVFTFNHNEFENWVKDLSAAIQSQFKK